MQPQRIAQPTLGRDRLLVLSSLGGLALLAWLYLIWTGRSMAQMGGDIMGPELAAWDTADFALRLAQWVVMMLAMMLPAAAPVALGYTSILHGRPRPAPISTLAALFTAGFLAVWAGFSALAVLAQWGLQAAAMAFPAAAAKGPVLGGALLAAAGLYQWTPLKHACLANCRSPLGFFLTRWREGRWGALVMGLRHGIQCTGCCWLLMGLMLLAGAMNLLWMAALTAFILIEKVAPAGEWIARAAGLLLVGWGAWLAAGGLF